MQSLLPALMLFTLGTSAFAGPADVIDVKVTRESGVANSYSFDVTISSDDTGWEKYADKWVVVAPDGKILGTRVLTHPHETEQPFTRSLGGVVIPADITTVTVRAHDKVEGFGGREFPVALPAN